jgi:hypothetical protein
MGNWAFGGNDMKTKKKLKTKDSKLKKSKQ